jgi:hypothetical protein
MVTLAKKSLTGNIGQMISSIGSIKDRLEIVKKHGRTRIIKANIGSSAGLEERDRDLGHARGARQRQDSA